MTRTLAIAALAALLSASPAPGAREVPVAITGARIVPVSGKEIPGGTVVLAGGKIAAVGPAGKVEIPPGAEVIDARGRWLLPGFVDPASTAGLPGQRPSGGTTPWRDPLPALDPASAEIRAARRAGYTTLVLLREGGGISGTGAAVRTAGASLEELVIARDVLLRMDAGTGTPAIQALRNPLLAAKKEIEARAKYEADRKAYEEAAAEHAKKVEAAKKKGEKEPAAPKDLKEPEAPKTDPRTESVRKAVRGEIPVLVRVDSAAELLHLADVVEGLDDLEVLVHFAGRDAGRVVDEIAERGYGVVLDPTLTSRPWTRILENVPAELVGRKVPIAFTSPRDPADTLLALAFLVRAGLPRDRALAAVTLVPARFAGLDGRLGSIEKGKDANLVLLSGDPFDARTRVVRVFLGGRTVHEEGEAR